MYYGGLPPPGLFFTFGEIPSVAISTPDVYPSVPPGSVIECFRDLVFYKEHIGRGLRWSRIFPTPCVAFSARTPSITHRHNMNQPLITSKFSET